MTAPDVRTERALIDHTLTQDLNAAKTEREEAAAYRYAYTSLSNLLQRPGS